MSSGTCNTVVDDEKCVRHQGHPGDHFGMSRLSAKAPAEPCGMPDPDKELTCAYPSGHSGTGHQVRDAEGVLHTWYGVPQADPSIPDSVRTRVRLHAAQTEYDLTVLKNRLDCMPTVTNVSKELRRKREQLIAELEAWQYFAGVAKRVD